MDNTRILSQKPHISMFLLIRTHICYYGHSLSQSTQPDVRDTTGQSGLMKVSLIVHLSSRVSHLTVFLSFAYVDIINVSDQ